MVTNTTRYITIISLLKFVISLLLIKFIYLVSDKITVFCIFPVCVIGIT